MCNLRFEKNIVYTLREGDVSIFPFLSISLFLFTEISTVHAKLSESLAAVDKS